MKNFNIKSLKNDINNELLKIQNEIFEERKYGGHYDLSFKDGYESAIKYVIDLLKEYEL